jgi:hypothetical protein
MDGQIKEACEVGIAFGRVTGDIGQLADHDAQPHAGHKANEDSARDESQRCAGPGQSHGDHHDPNQDRQHEQCLAGVVGVLHAWDIGNDRRHCARDADCHRRRRGEQRASGHAHHVPVEGVGGIDVGDQTSRQGVGDHLGSENSARHSVLLEGVSRHLVAIEVNKVAELGPIHVCLPSCLEANHDDGTGALTLDGIATGAFPGASGRHKK